MPTPPLAWDPNQLWNKALSYVERASRAADEDTGPLFACLALELLARAALTAIHPVLNADPQSEGAHILYACGISAKSGSPKSIPVHAVFARLEAAYPEFKTHRPICEYLTNVRNEELHTGLSPFEGLDESKWLADYYGAVEFLCANLGKPLEEYLGDEADHARSLITARKTSRIADVKKAIATHRSGFEGLSEAAKADATQRATADTMFRTGRSAPCPACKSSAVLDGDELKRSEPTYEDGEIVVTVTHATSSLKCSACGLQLRTLEDCVVAETAPRFVSYEVKTLHDLHQDEDYVEYDNM